MEQTKKVVKGIHPKNSPDEFMHKIVKGHFFGFKLIKQ